MGLLDSVLGRTKAGSGGMSPLTLAVVGLLAYHALKGKGGLGQMLGASPSPAPGQAPPPPSGIGGLLSGFLGGSGNTGAVLSNGLSDLVRQFQQKGLGDTVQSWIGSGPNQPLGPAELEKALGPEKIDWLVRETGLSREQLLNGLSRELPGTVDKLTPDGRIPAEHEARQML
jgi:uncharacterized protein YidB (DUF937 family)